MKFYVRVEDFEKIVSGEKKAPKLFTFGKALGELTPEGKLEESFFEVELKPIEKVQGFLIEINLFGMRETKRGSSHYFSGEEISRNSKKVHPPWLKVFRAISGMKFTVPISVTLNSDGCYYAIEVNRIGDNIFSYQSGSDNFVLFPGQNFSRTVLPATHSKIREEFEKGLKRFLEETPNKNVVMRFMRYGHPDNEKRLYQTFFCPSPANIQVVE